MSIFPYIYYMIESFNITNDQNRIALYAGLVTSVFAGAECLGAGFWGGLSDRIGRKPVLLTGLAGTGISMLMFGFAPNLAVALVARAVGGALNGNIGVLQTTVNEVVKVEAHQARAYAIMPTVWPSRDSSQDPPLDRLHIDAHPLSIPIYPAPRSQTP